MRINASNINQVAFNMKSQNKIHTTTKKEENVNVNKNVTQQDKNAKAGGLQDILQAISERRQKITDSKNELINKTLESGGSLTDIAEPLKMFEQQLKNLDKERQLAMAKEAEKNKESQKAGKSDKAEKVQKPKTEEEAQIENINKTAEKVARFDTIEGSLSMANGMKSRVKVLESEMKMDSLFRNDFERNVLKTATSHTSAVVNLDSSSKEKEIARLNKNIEKLNKSASEGLAQVNDEVAKEIKTQIKATDKKGVDTKKEPEIKQEEENVDATAVDTYA